MNYASAFVFPLQGFWNVVAYMITSQSTCRHLWLDVMQFFGRTSSQPIRSERSFSETSSRTLTRASMVENTLDETKSTDYAHVQEPERAYVA